MNDDFSRSAVMASGKGWLPTSEQIILITTVLLILQAHVPLLAVRTDVRGSSNFNRIVNEDEDFLPISLNLNGNEKRSREEEYEPFITAKSRIIIPTTSRLDDSLKRAQIEQMAMGYKPNQHRVNLTITEAANAKPLSSLTDVLETLNAISTSPTLQNATVINDNLNRTSDEVETKISDKAHARQLVSPRSLDVDIANATVLIPRESRSESAASDGDKKDARPNVITNSTIKGFLAKNDNFTIHDVKKDANKSSGRGGPSESPKEKSLDFMLPVIANKGSLTNITVEKVKNLAANVQDQTMKSSTETESDHLSRVHLVSPEEFTRKRIDMPHLQIQKPLTVIQDESAVKKELVHHEYYECGENRTCPKGRFCDHHICYDCHRLHHECIEDYECCDGLPCVYGRCDRKPKGSPGSICDKDKDCGDNGCCVLEPTISEDHGICKRKLQEYHQCSPVLFRKVWVGDERPQCGPCAKGLECKERGVLASHLVCLKQKKV